MFLFFEGIWALRCLVFFAFRYVMVLASSKTVRVCVGVTLGGGYADI